MKCGKAQDLYFLSRDGALDEAGRMELARHLAHCGSCGVFVREMEASLDAARALPELAASDGFEWNVKRRILQEKSRLMRRDAGADAFSGKRWAFRFATGAAAAAVVIASTLFVMGRSGGDEPRILEASRDTRASSAPILVPSSDGVGLSDYRAAGAYGGPRMVSDHIFTIERSGENASYSPFESIAGSREDSLAKENELLRQRMQRLERQLMIYKSMLDKERMQRINMSLP